MNHADRRRRERKELLEPKPWWERWWRRFEIVAVVVGFPSSFFSSVVLFWPQVNVNLDKTLNPSDAFATQFAVANGSNFSMRQVHFSCIVNMPPMVINNHNEPEVPLDEVNAGETVVRGCGMVTKDVPFNSTIDVEVTYQYPLLGTRQVSVHFESRRDTNGIPQWFKTIKTPARLSTQ